MSNYRLMQGDCIKLMQQLPDNSIDLIVTDPPYEHVMGGMKSKIYNIGTWKADSYINMKMSQFKKKDIFCFLDTAIPKMKKVNMFVFCSRLQLAHYFDYLNQHKKLKYDLLVWDKSSKDDKYGMKSSMFYTSDIEYVLRIYESGVHLFKVLTEDETKSDYRYYMKRQKFVQPKGLHESMKPVELLERYIKVSTNENDTVLDCFMGSGSTGVACVNTNRNFIGMELNGEYYNIAKDRIEKAVAKHE